MSEYVELGLAEHHRAVFERSLSGFAHCRLIFEGDRVVDWIYLSVNAAFVRLTGRDDAVGRRICELIPDIAVVDPMACEAFARVARTGDPERFESRVAVPGAWCEVTASRVGPGELAVVFDLASERKRVATALEESREHLASVLSSLDDLVFSIDAERRFTHYHTPSEALLYAPPSAFLGRRYVDVLPADVSALLDEAIARVEADGRTAQFDCGLTLNGELAWWSVKVSRRNGAPGGFTVVSRNITTRIRDREALRDREAQLRAMFDLAPLGIAQADPNTWRLLVVNPRMCAITGYAADELVGMAINDLTHPDDHTRDRELFVRVMRGEAQEYHVERRYVRKDGRVAWVNVNMTVMRDPQGGSPRVVATIEDITERREAEATRRLQTRALEAAANGIAITDIDGRIQWVNPAFTRLTGYAPAEVLGQHTRVLRSGAQSEAFYAHLWQTVLGGAVWHGQLVNRRKDGTLYNEEMTITPARDERGVIDHFVAVKQDVTERERARVALEEASERYRTLVDSLDDVIYSTDLDGRFTFVNRAVEHFGFKPEELVGLSRDALTHPDDVAMVRRRYQDPASAQRPVVHRLLDAAGRVRTVRCNARPLVVADKVLGVTGVIEDLTAQYETEEQLRAAQKMEAIGLLAGGVAHDFNNILTVILSYTQFAKDGLRADDPLRADLDEVETAAKRAEALTRQLLAFGRRQVLRLEPASLDELVAGLSKMLKRLIGEDVELSVRPAAAACEVLADKGQIEQVIMNLVVNARDAMPDGGQVTIATASVAVDEARAAALQVEQGAYVELSVTDTGHGMDAATRARIFEPFFTTKPMGRGTGLGLSMVYGLVKQSGGGVEVESEPGKGTRFRVYLPRHEGASVEPSRPPAPLLTRGRERILFVEDEAALRKAAERMLNAAGYDVLMAADAFEALRVAAQHGPSIHLIVTDVVMPGMNGKELADRLAPLCPAARVLFTSGYTHESIARHGVLGLNFLTKPYGMPSLTAAVRAVLDAR